MSDCNRNPGERDRAVQVAEQALAFVHDIYPICRSITGQGVRDTLARVAAEIPIQVLEVPSGEQVFDWEVPPEWNVRDAYVANMAGERVIDFRAHNLHLMSYSTPVRARMPLSELRTHLHTLPERPDWIPYRTSYYRRDWGFCLQHSRLERLPEGEYDVVVDTDLSPGSLTYGELFIAGATSEEVLLCTHVCHPSLANDNCSGIALLTLLGVALRSARLRNSYRLLFAPGTIGAVTWLARNEQHLDRISAGLVVGLLGDPGPMTYKRSRNGDSPVDRIAARVLQSFDAASRILPFSPYGYDERQYCSPGVDLPVGRLTRSVNDGYPQYHTSADNPELLSIGALAQSYRALEQIIRELDDNRRFRNLCSRGEPRLGKRGLFRPVGGCTPAQFEHALLWMLNQSDGVHGLNDIAAFSGLDRPLLEEAAHALQRAGLLEEIEEIEAGAARRKPRASGRVAEPACEGES